MSLYRLRASSAGRWKQCTASVSMQEDFPNESCAAAEEGTAAHWVGSNLIQGTHYSEVAPNGLEITPVMINSAEVYANYVKGWNMPTWIEQGLHIKDIHEECGGTADAFGYDEKTNVLRVCDFKHGFGPVEVYENWQLLCYLSGVMTKLKEMGTSLKETKVELSVVQPRAIHPDGRIRKWYLFVEQAEPYFKQLRASAKEALNERPVATVGKQCRYCLARHQCNALVQSSYVAIRMSKDVCKVHLNTKEASSELMQIEEAINVLESRRSGLSVQVERALKSGESSPFYILDQVRKREVWKEGVQEQVVLLGKILGKELKKPQELITPAQARKLKINEDLIKQFSCTPASETKLVRIKPFGENAS